MYRLPDTRAHYASTRFQTLLNEFAIAARAVAMQGGLTTSAKQAFAEQMRAYTKTFEPLTIFSLLCNQNPHPTMMAVENLDTNSRAIGAPGFVGIKRIYATMDENEVSMLSTTLPIMISPHVHDRWNERIVQNSRYKTAVHKNPYGSPDFKAMFEWGCMLLYAAEHPLTHCGFKSASPIMIPIANGLAMGDIRPKISPGMSGEAYSLRAIRNGGLYTEQDIRELRWEPKNEAYIYTVVDRALLRKPQLRIFDALREIRAANRETFNHIYCCMIESRNERLPNGTIKIAYTDQSPALSYAYLRIMRQLSEVMKTEDYKTCAFAMARNTGRTLNAAKPWTSPLIGAVLGAR